MTPIALAAARTEIATLKQTIMERNQLCRDMEEDESGQMRMLGAELVAMREVLDGLFSTACNGLIDTESYWMEKASKMLGYSE